MKVVVVGGVAGGASAAARIRRLDEKAQITIFERGENVSFSNCSLPYYLGGVVETEEDLVMMTPEAFHHKHNIDVLVRHEVTAIHRDKKTVHVKNLATGREFDEPYDKLILSPGASPIRPGSIAGVNGENVFTIRNVQDIAKVKACMNNAATRNVVVIGGGFIGVETAENLVKAGKNVTIVEGTLQIMAPFDYDMVQMLHKELDDHGVVLHLGTTVVGIDEKSVYCTCGEKSFDIPADAVILTIGVAPETALVRDAGLEIGLTRGIAVNRHFQTTDPDIYAVGDAVETFNRLTGKPGRLALAGPAQKQARIAANHICGLPGEDEGFIGSSCIRIFGLNAASTGLNEKSAKAEGIAYDFATVIASDKVGIMPECHYLALKLLFEVPAGKLLGVQAIGQGEVDKRVDAVAAIIGMGGTVQDLINFEHCYAPLFSTAKDVVHMAALVAGNLLDGTLKQVHVADVRSLVEQGAYIVDVREPDEYELSHIKGAHNVPLTDLREHLDEIPRDVPVYLHCRSSQRSYYAYRYLLGNSFTNVVNISGSFLGISLHEYFNDKTLGREPILTGYNFD